MMIREDGIEDLMSLNEAAGLFPRRRKGKRPAFSTIWRWATVGVNGARLETVRVGSTLCTTRAAVERFIEAQSAGPGDAGCAVGLRSPSRPGEGGRTYRSPGKRERAVRKAEEILRGAGY